MPLAKVTDFRLPTAQSLVNFVNVCTFCNFLILDIFIFQHGADDLVNRFTVDNSVRCRLSIWCSDNCVQFDEASPSAVSSSRHAESVHYATREGNYVTHSRHEFKFPFFRLLSTIKADWIYHSTPLNLALRLKVRFDTFSNYFKIMKIMNYRIHAPGVRRRLTRTGWFICRHQKWQNTKLFERLSGNVVHHQWRAVIDFDSFRTWSHTPIANPNI